MDHIFKENQKINTSFKWYWKINYFITSYLVLVSASTPLQIYSSFIKLNPLLIKILTIDGFLILPVNIFIYGIQILATILILIFKKSERTRWHYWYLALIIILSVIKIIGVLAIVFFGLPTVAES
jgi:hypothetical protein